jgi:Tol biopolymer transport system component/DNA-binding winged helix-turn-helix (wHTH) protein
MDSSRVVYEFGGFSLDRDERVLRRGNLPVPLTPKATEILLALVERHGHIVDKEDLMRQVWPDTAVEESNLTQNIYTLRKVLSTEEGRCPFIETVPRRGYRFVGFVRTPSKAPSHPLTPLMVRAKCDVQSDGPTLPGDVRSIGMEPAAGGTAASASGREVLAATVEPPGGRLRGRPGVHWGVTALAAVSIGAALFWSTPSRSRLAGAPERPEMPLEAVPLTTYPGHEAEPAFSPDGAQVAFSWDGESQDNHDIFVKAIGAEQPHRLTSDRARDGSPAWSPDGTGIAFLRDKPGGGSEVRLIPPTGGPERTIGEVQGLAHQGLSWSPDGRSLAVVDRSSPGERLGIFVLDILSGVKKRLTPPSTHGDILPAFSPDGRSVAFNRTLPTRGPFLHVVPVAGGEPRALVPTSFRRGRMAWMPGGKEILFAAVPVARDGGRPAPSSAGRAAACLWRVPAGGGQARLLAGSENAVDVAVSGDGHRLVYSQETMDWDIWRLDLRRGPATGDAQTRFIASTKADANPQVSPDGERVAFTSLRSGQQELWVVDGQGRHPLRLTSSERDEDRAAPRWSPDGNAIAFDQRTKNPDNVDIYVISASGGRARRVTTSSAIDAHPSWSRDGRWIYFASNRTGSWQVWKVLSTGEEAGSARQVTQGGGFAAIESTDGRHVYFTRELSWFELQNSLWRIPVEGGDEEVVVERYRSSVGSWDLTAEGLYFVDQEPSSSGTSWVVRFQGFDQRHATEVARLRYPPFLGGPAVSVSSDGRWMLSTQSQGESDLMLAESFR